MKVLANSQPRLEPGTVAPMQVTTTNGRSRTASDLRRRVWLVCLGFGLLALVVCGGAPLVGPTPIDLRRVFAEWVVGADSSDNIVVLRTLPGSAHVVASAIDRSGLDEVLGTVAGDDTIMVVAAEGIEGRTLAEELRELAGLE